jgi:hypothetical protein
MIKRYGFCCRVIGLLLLAAGFGLPAVSQETAADPFNAGAAPDIVRRPQQGEAPRYPRDTVIGDLGRGTAPESAWALARSVMDALVRGAETAPALAAGGESLTERLFSSLEIINPTKYRLGGGRVEADGTVSFLARFLGRDQSVTGELYLVREQAAEDGSGGSWQLDDLILEEAKDLAAEHNGYQYDFSPYERFY